MLNGNLGVTKSMMTGMLPAPNTKALQVHLSLLELTDSTNRAQGFALLPVVWSTGATIGQVLSLRHPELLLILLRLAGL